jgi:glycine/D-amino acid oxidase-like deaminating enzyme
MRVGRRRSMLATGHSVWGILNAPATGEVMSELILDGAARHVDLAPFAPGRLPPLDGRARMVPLARDIDQA